MLRILCAGSIFFKRGGASGRLVGWLVGDGPGRFLGCTVGHVIDYSLSHRIGSFLLLLIHEHGIAGLVRINLEGGKGKVWDCIL